MSVINTRRKFLWISASLAATAPLYWLWQRVCEPTASYVKGVMLSPSFQRGHSLWKMAFSKPKTIEEVDTLIIGGGVSSLSAARQFLRKGHTDFLLLELEDHTGGNARYGHNATGRFPLGAHYLPIPSPDQKELIELLLEYKLITHIDVQGLPHYEEQYLCHDPDERLFIHGHWQEGLMPNFGVPTKDLAQLRAFTTMMNAYKEARGSDGKYAFDIPLDQSSTDQVYRSLDRMSMKDFLREHKLDSPYLHWYVSYCCKDDFGSSLDETSAWAGVHYFAARRGRAGNADAEHVLTWPEGNGWLAERLSEGCKAQTRTACMAFAVYKNTQGNYDVHYVDYKSNRVKCARVNKILFNCPTYILKHLRTNIKALKERAKYKFEFSTWVVANAEVDGQKLAERNGFPLCWDNVIYGSEALGYINSTHQQLMRHQPKHNFTWYQLCTAPEGAAVLRKKALGMGHQHWVAAMVQDMSKVYSKFEESIVRCDVCVWGHAMVKPKIGLIWGEERAQAQQPIEGSLFFAHTELSGMSLFEEAFYRGLHVADQALNS